MKICATRLWVLGLAGGVFLATLTGRAQVVLHVDAGAADGGDGLSWATAYNSLQVALGRAASDASEFTEIRVAAGTYRPSALTDARARSATFLIPAATFLFGGFAGTERSLGERDLASNQTILSGDIGVDGDDSDNSFHVVRSDSAGSGSLLDGFTLARGNANSSGRGAAFGGGILIDGSNLTVSSCIVRGNRAQTGGGIGMLNRSSPTIVNCILSGNRSNIDAAGMAVFNSTPRVLNCTFSGNEAPSSRNGGGIYVANDGHPVVTNCILWGNLDQGGTDESAQIHVAGGDVSVNHSCIQGLTGVLGGSGNIGNDPLFVDADGPDDTPGTVDDDLRVREGSPCLDAGDGTAVPLFVLTDIDGDPRFSRVVDIGAHEFPSPPQGSPAAELKLGEGVARSATEVEIQLTLTSGDPVQALGVVFDWDSLACTGVDLEIDSTIIQGADCMDCVLLNVQNNWISLGLVTTTNPLIGNDIPVATAVIDCGAGPRTTETTVSFRDFLHRSSGNSPLLFNVLTVSLQDVDQTSGLVLTDGSFQRSSRPVGIFEDSGAFASPSFGCAAQTGEWDVLFNENLGEYALAYEGGNRFGGNGPDDYLMVHATKMGLDWSLTAHIKDRTNFQRPGAFQPIAGLMARGDLRHGASFSAIYEDGLIGRTVASGRDFDTAVASLAADWLRIERNQTDVIMSYSETGAEGSWVELQRHPWGSQPDEMFVGLFLISDRDAPPDCENPLGVTVTFDDVFFREVLFRRGDADEDGILTVTDAIQVLSNLFLEGDFPLPCRDAADSDNDGIVTLSDAIVVLNCLFIGTRCPQPRGECAADSGADELDCASFDGCQ